MNETPFMRALEIALNAPERPTRVQRVNSGRVVVEDTRGRRVIRGARTGTADLVGRVRPEGWYLEVEAKAFKGKLSAAQRAHGKAVSRDGGIYVVVAGPKEDDELDAALARALEVVDAEVVARRARG